MQIVKKYGTIKRATLPKGARELYNVLQTLCDDVDFATLQKIAGIKRRRFATLWRALLDCGYITIGETKRAGRGANIPKIIYITTERKRNTRARKDITIFKAKSAQDIPTLQQVKDYAEQKHSYTNADEFYAYYQARDWHTKDGRVITNWRAVFDYWSAKADTNAKAHGKRTSAEQKEYMDQVMQRVNNPLPTIKEILAEINAREAQQAQNKRAKVFGN